MDWVVFGMYAVIGLVNLCVPVRVTKWDYSLVWVVLMFQLLARGVGV